MDHKIFGINYINPETSSWAPHPWIGFDESRLKKDFEIASKMGMSVVRQFLTAISFIPTPEKVNNEALEKMTRYVAIAKSFGLQILFTGPDHWEGKPEWMIGDVWTDLTIKEALVIFWKTIAKTFVNEKTIYGWDIINEPSLPFEAVLTNTDDIYKEQLRREKIATEWVKFQSDAIKSEDNSHPVTLGFIQFSFPLKRNKPQDPSGYNPFQPNLVAPYLDYLSIHFYPMRLLEKQELRTETELQNFLNDNLEYLLAWVAYTGASGKPVQIDEFGLWGGGSPQNKPFISGEIQNKYCTDLISLTHPFVRGWLNWTLYDIPKADDISMFTGLLTADGKTKKWGESFSKIAFEGNMDFSSMPKPRPIIPFKVSKYDLLTKPSVETDLNELISKQKKENVIKQLILES